MPTVSPCPTNDDLAGFRAGQTNGERTSTISHHLDTCTQCQAKLDETETLTRLLRQQPLSALAAEAGYRRLDDWVLSDATRPYEATQTLDRPKLRPADPGTADIGRVGPYRILGVLGEGSMGVVYEARDTRLDRPVALKVLKPYWSGDEASRSRFLREAKAAAKIVDDRIVAVFDVGEDDGVPYIAMALVQGQSLERRLRDQPRPTTAEIVDVARQIALGLSVAHAHGLIHRDIKPANIWIENVPTSEQSPFGLRVKLLDFGLARSLGEDVRLTQSGTVIGTPAYMSPEQAAGGDADERSDLFSLGCILYRMTTGALPFPGKDTLAIVFALANKNPPPPHRGNPEVPESLSAIVMKLLAKNPASRFASALDVVAALATPPAEPRRRWPVALTAAAFLVAMALAFAYWPTTPQEKEFAENPNPAKPVAPNNLEKKPGETPAIEMPVPIAEGLLEDGQHYRIKNVNSKKALAVEDKAKDDGALIVQITVGPRDHQQWRFVKVGSYYQIVNRRSGKALNVQSGSEEEGAPIIQWDPDDDADNQQWTIEKLGPYFVFRVRHTGMVLDVANEAKERKSPLIQYPYTGSANQLFELVPIKK